MGKVFFISGIDTDAGKTVVTGLLAKSFVSQGKKVITQKLVQTGCYGIAEDIVTHRKIMGTDLFPEDISLQTCPFVFSHPSSPELAASMENKKIDLDIISKNTEAFSEKFDLVLLEGAGGLMVPVTENKMIIDIIKEHQYSLLLVSSSKLGSINHTLLSLEVCKNYGIHVAAVFYNHYPAKDTQILNNSRNVIMNYLKLNFPDTLFFEIPVVEIEESPVLPFELLTLDT